MRAIVFDLDPLLGPAMRAALPGIKWELAVGPGKKRGVTEVARAALVKHLRSLPTSTQMVKARDAKAVISGIVGELLRSKTWQRVRRGALAEVDGWGFSGHSFHRI